MRKTIWPWCVAFALLELPLATFLIGWRFDGSPPHADGKPVALIPQSELPGATDDLKYSLDLVNRYPGDPRGHMFRGIYFLEHQDIANAEQEFRAALDEAEVLKKDMPPDIEQSIRMTLSVVLANTGRRPEAVTIAMPVCRQNIRSVEGVLSNRFYRAGVCDKN